MVPPLNAKLTLTYPIFTCDFDSHNSDFLVVGGGGGEGRSGVGNKITLIDASKRHELAQVLDIDLSREEDSVTSLAVAHSTTSSATVLAGINSSSAAQKAGQNEHLRSFRLTYPPKRKREESNHQNDKDGGDNDAKNKAAQRVASAAALGKVALFASASQPAKDTYQRVLRLAAAAVNRRLGVIATGFAPAGEIVVFNAAKEAPGPKDVERRIQLKEGEEAADVDVVETKGGEAVVAYCSNNGIFAAAMSRNPKSQMAEPVNILASSRSRTSDKRFLAFRCLRFLTPTLLLALQNLPGRSGAEVLLVDMPSPSKLGSIVGRKRLPSSIKSATAMATATLMHEIAKESTQHVIAVGSQDIAILTVDVPINRTSSALQFRLHSLLRNLHPNQITSLAFSTFKAPLDGKVTPNQYLKLASTSMASTVVVHTLPLRSSKSRSTPSRFRYILRPPTSSQASQMGFSVFVSVVVIAIGAFFLQAWLEIRGGTTKYLGARDWLSEHMQQFVDRAFGDEIVLPLSIPKVEKTRDRMVETFEHPWEAEDGHVHQKRSDGAKAAVVEDFVLPSSIPMVKKVRDRVVETYEHPWESAEREADLEDARRRFDRLDEKARRAREARARFAAQKATEGKRTADATRRAQDAHQRANNAEKIRQAMAHVGRQKRGGGGHQEFRDEHQEGGIPADEEHIDRLMAQLDDIIAQEQQHPEQVTHDPEMYDPAAYVDNFADETSPLPRTALEPHQVVVFHDAGDSVDVEVHNDHGAQAAREAKQWEQLSHRQRAVWKRKLIEAGHWTAEQGEQVLQGAFFGALAGVVGGMAG